MKIIVWHECYISGGADWSLINLINNWPCKDDTFLIYVNKSHEGIKLLNAKVKKKHQILNFISISDRINNSFLFNKFQKSMFLKKILFYIYFFREFFILKNKIFKKIDYDVLLINNGGYPGAMSSYIIIFLNFFLKRKKSFMIIRNYPVNTIYFSLNMIISKFVINNFLNKIIVVSESLKKSMITRAGLKKNKVNTIYNGIDLKSNEIKKNVFFGNIGIIGNFEKRKGHIFLLESISKFVKKFDNIKLHIVGSFKSGNKKEIINKIAELKLLKYVEMINYKKNIKIIYQKLDILAVPSLYNESFGRVAVEAMSQGVVVIASKTGGLKEIINHNKDGFLFRPNDQQDFLKYLSIIYENAEKRKNFIVNGHIKFKKFFTAKIMANKYYNLIVRDF